MTPFGRTLVGAALLLSAVAAPAATPSVGGISPRGAQRGTEAELTFSGDRLSDAQEVLLYAPGITVEKLEIVNNTTVKAKVKIAPDARLGEYDLRLRTLTGISDLRTFYVGALPVVAEAEPNSDFEKPQKIALNVTVTGVIENEDVDYFVVEAKKGDRITAEVEGMRLGMTLFDPYVSIMDTKRFDLASNDDSALLLQDPVASVVAPADGNYIIQVRETSYGGSGACAYRMHVGTFPRPRVAFPAGGKAGEETKVTFVGDVAGPIEQTVKVPADATSPLDLFAEQNNQTAPSSVHFRVSPFGNVMEVEPNNDPSHATKATGDLPLAFNGVIDKDKDADFFRFTAKKGQVFDVNVYARRIRSPLDPVLVIHKGDGAGLASNDDSGGPDSYLRFTVPEDGEYVFQVYDHLLRGSPDSVYRVEVTPVQPALTLSIPNIGSVPTQERQVVVVPKGNRYGTLVRATRADFGGEVTLQAPELPAGVTMQTEPVQPNLDVVPVVFEAAADAPVAGKLVALTAKPADDKVKVAGKFRQEVDLVTGVNNVRMYATTVDKLAVAVADEAPFKLSIVQPKVPLVQQGQMQLKVVAERKAGFTGGIHLQMLFDPPGVGSGQADIPGDKNEAYLPLNASGGAQVRKWKIAVLGSSTQPDAPKPAEGKPAQAPGTVPAAGPVWVSSQLADLEIAPPVLLGKIEMAATEQGKPAPVLCKLDPKTKFDGKAKLQLVGLPPNASTTELEISAADTQAVFNVNVDAKTPAGQHNQLAAILTLIKDGEPIVQTVTSGGVLRVDPPPPPKPNEPAKPAATAAKPPDKAPEKILSRLEKLRLEQAAKAGK
jgi:hypothetical protein